VQVTVNQRTLVSYGDFTEGNASSNLRSFNLDAVPTEAIAGLTVYKSPLAENIEPGLGGLLNLQTLRPLDYKAPAGKSDKFFGSATIRGEVDNLAKVLKPRYSAALGLKLFDDTLGIFVSGLIADTRTRTDIINFTNTTRDIAIANATGGGSTTFRGVYTHENIDVYGTDFDRKRRTGSAAVQWRPTSNLEVNLDYTYNQFNNNQDRQRNQFAITGPQIYGSPGSSTRPATAEGLVIQQPGDVTIENGAVTGFLPTRGGVTQTSYNTQSSFQINESTTQFGGANIAWKDDGWKLNFDYGHSQVDYFSNILVGYARDVPTPITFSTVNGDPNFQFGEDVFSLNPGETRFFFSGQTNLRTVRDAFRLDGEIDINSDFKFKAGVRRETTTVDSRSGSVFSFLPRANRAFGFGDPNASNSFGAIPREQTFTEAQLDALDAAFLPGGTFSTFPNLGLGNLPATSISGYCSVATELCGLSIRNRGSLYTGSFPSQTDASGNVINDGTNDININPGQSYFAREQNWALYGSLEGSSRVFGIDVDGNIGLRAVHIALESRAFGSVRRVTRLGTAFVEQSTTRIPTRDTNSYWQFLPNLNLNFHPTSNLNVRFGVARSISLPQYNETAPAGSVSIVDTTAPGYDPVRDQNFGSFGNTQLEPTSAWNFDLTAEYYTSTRGSIVLSLFYKDISNLILAGNRTATVAGQSGTFFLTGPTNLSKATVKGFEIGANQPLTFLPSPLDGFGVQANYTFVDSSIASTEPEAQFGVPGTSRHSVSAIGYYEKYGLGVRLGYTYRTSFLLGLGPTGLGVPLSNLQAPLSNLDLNVSYAITKNIEINGSINNIQGEGRRDFSVVPEALLNFYNRPTTYTFGVRASF